MAAYYFDLNGATAGFGTLTGAWDTTTTNWSTSSAGTVATAAVTFTNADSANFGFAGTTATAGTATISTGITVTLNQIISANLAGLQTIAAAGTGSLVLDGATPTISVGSAGNMTISAPISGTLGLTKTGANTLTLTNNNTGLTGTITVNGGTLTAGANGTTGAFGAAANNIVVTSGTASVNRSNAYQIDGSITGAGTFSKVTGTGDLTLTTTSTISVATLNLNAGTTFFPQTSDHTVSSAITGAGNITKSGNSITTLSGVGTNTGAWAINAGTLNVTAAQNSGGAGTVTLAAGTALTTTATLNKAITIPSTATATIGGGTGALTIAGTGVTFTQVAAASSSATTPHTISGASTTTVLTVNTNRTLTSSDSVVIGKATSGVTAIYQTGGTIDCSNTSTGAGGLLIAGTATGAYTYYRGTGGTLSAAAIATMSTDLGFAAGSTFVGDFDGVSASFVRFLSFSNATNAGAALNVLSGTFSVTGAGNFFFGESTTGSAVRPQVLTIGKPGSSATFAAAGSISMQSGATANTTLTLLNVTNGSTLSPGGSLIFAGTATKRVNLWNGTLSIGSSITTAGTAPQIVLYGGSGTNTISTAGTAAIPVVITEATGYGVSALNYTQGSGYVGAPLIQITGGSGQGATARAVVDVTPASPTQGQITSIVVTNPGTGYLAGDVLSFTATGGGPTVAITPGSITLAPNAAPEGFTKAGSGTIQLTAANTYTGLTTISAGTLNIGAAGSVGTLGNANAGSVNLSGANTFLILGRTDAVTYSGTISGVATSTLRRASAASNSAATLTGDNSAFAGSVTIDNANTLTATGTNALGNGGGGITITTTTGALNLNGVTTNKTLSIAGTGVASGGAIVANAGTSNTLSGTVAFTASSLLTTASGAGTSLTFSNTGTTTGAFGVTFSTGTDSTLTFVPILALGANTLTKTAAGTLSLRSANSSFSGAITFSGGTIEVTRLANTGTNSSLGTTATALVIPNGSTLRHIGGFTSYTNRALSSTATLAGTLTLDASGTDGSGNSLGAMGFTAAPTGGAGAAVTKTLALTGTNTNNNGIAFALTNTALTASGTVALSKDGVGTWVMSNSGNTYTGGTTISNGTLVADASDGSARFGGSGGTNGNVSVGASGKIQTLTGTTQKGRHTYNGNLTFASGARLRIGGGVTPAPILLSGALTLPSSGTAIFDLSKDLGYNKAGTYTLFEFPPSVAATISGGTLASNVTVSTWPGLTAGTPAVVAENLTNGTPARIVVTLT